VSPIPLELTVTTATCARWLLEEVVVVDDVVDDDDDDDGIDVR
jgi:hypothetical protein